MKVLQQKIYLVNFSVCMGGTKTQIPHPGGPRGFQNQKSPTPGPPGDSAHQIPHPLGDGGFQNSIIYQAKFCTDYYPINPLFLILPLEYLFSWVERADQPFPLPTCQIVGDFCVKKFFLGIFIGFIDTQKCLNPP